MYFFFPRENGHYTILHVAVRCPCLFFFKCLPPSTIAFHSFFIFTMCELLHSNTNIVITFLRAP